jgi:prevent-host-death family protein
MAKLKDLDVFSVRDLRVRSGELLRDAEKGRMAVITKHGRPAILALPFDERLLRHGVARALALQLFEAGRLTLARAAKLAEMSVEEFIELLGTAGIDAVTYSPDELEAEAEAVG